MYAIVNFSSGLENVSCAVMQCLQEAQRRREHARLLQRRWQEAHQRPAVFSGSATQTVAATAAASSSIEPRAIDIDSTMIDEFILK